MKLVFTLLDCNSDMPGAYAVQVVLLAWNAYIEAVELLKIPNALQAYVFHIERRVRFDVISSPAVGYAPQMQ